MKLKILQQDTAVVTGNKTFNSGDLISLKIKKKIKYKILLFSGNLISSAGSLGPSFIPRGVTASYGTYEDKILVQWNNIPGVNGYKVFKNDTTLAGTVSTNSFFDTESLPGTLFKYNIKSFVKQNGFTLESNLSSPAYSWRGLTAPANFTTSDGSYFDRVILSWNGVTGATAYKVYRYDTSVPPQTLSLLATTTDTAYTDYNVLIGREYIYALKSSCALGDSNFGVTGNASLTRGYIFPPSGVTASQGTYTNRVNITWNSISGISGYKIYRNLPTLQNVGNTSGTQFDDYTATPNTIYTYYVTSYDLRRGESSPSATTTGYVDSVFYIYVSTAGNDNNTGEDPTDGLSTGPVATLNKAVQIASNYTGPRNNIEILLKQGIYKFLGTTLSPVLYLEGITKNITFKNYNSETVIITGAEHIPYSRFSLISSNDSKWNRFKSEVTSNIYVADVSDFDLGVLPTNWRGKRITGGDNGNIPDLPGIPWLVYNDQMMTLARWPNKTGITSSGYSYTECATISNSPNSIIDTSPRSYNIFKYRDEYDTTIQRWVNNGAITDGAWINIFGYYDWVSETVKVTGITLSSAINSGFTASIKLDMRSSNYGIQNYSLCNGGLTYTNPTPRRWFIENIIDELDAPGEYYIDRSNKKLYFYPPTPIGTTSSILLTHRATYGPAALEADQPLKMTYERGYNSSSGNPVYNSAVGNTFGYYPYEGWTGSYIKNVGYANSGGLIQSRYPWNTVATIDSMFKFYKTKNVNIDGLIFKNCSGSGIKLELCENITIKNCLIYNMKKNAIRSLGGKNISIQDCLIQDIGSDAVINVGGNRRTLEYGNNTVTGCLIRRWATNGPDQGNGIVINGCGNTVSYNVFDEGFGKAIENNNSNFNTIEYNYFNNILADTDDQGAIYSYASRSSFGNTIRYNFFDNIGTKLPGGIAYVNRPWPNIGDAIYSGCTGPETLITPAIYIDGYENFANIYANTFYRCKNPAGCIYSAGTLHDVTNNIFIDSSAAISILRPSYNTLNTSYSSFLEAQKNLNLFNDPWLEQGAGYSAGQLQLNTGYGPWNSFVSNFGDDYYLIYDNNNGYTGSKGMMNVVDITTSTWQQAEPRLTQLITISGSGVDRRMGLSLGYASTAKTTYTNNLVTGCCGSYWIGATGSYSLPSNPLIGGFSGASNNMVTSGFTGFTNKQNLNFKLTTKGLSDVQAVIPQFQNVPFESIPTISYNPVGTAPPILITNNNPFLIFYDGGTGIYPRDTDIRNMTGRNEVAAFNALGAQRMPFAQLLDPYYLWRADGLPGQTTGWSNNQPADSLRYGEGYDTSAFNYVTSREVAGIVRSLVLQGVTASDTKYVYINWTEDHRDIDHFGFGVMTGPSDSVDLVSFDGGTSYVEQPRAIISENNQGKTQKQNFTELSNTIAKIISGGTGTDGIYFNGLKYYFPKCKFGVYNWPIWNYYFSDGKNNLNVTPDELQNRINFYADSFIAGMSAAIDSLDMFMPSFYCSLNSPYFNRIRSIQGVSMCVAINNKLQQQGKAKKEIIPFICPLYLTNQTATPYEKLSYPGTPYNHDYIPPYTVMLNNELNYQQLEPIVTAGGNGATIWISGEYLTTTIMGRVTDGKYEDTTPRPSWQKWPFLHPGGTTAGINQWSDKTIARQAISAHYNYTKGVCLGITGNRWWWASAGITKARSSVETYTPQEWLPLGISLAPYGNKVAYNNGSADAGATSSESTLNIIREVIEDSKYRSIVNFIDLWNIKYNYNG